MMTTTMKMLMRIMAKLRRRISQELINLTFRMKMMRFMSRCFIIRDCIRIILMMRSMRSIQAKMTKTRMSMEMMACTTIRFTAILEIML